MRTNLPLVLPLLVLASCGFRDDAPAPASVAAPAPPAAAAAPGLPALPPAPVGGAAVTDLAERLLALGGSGELVLPPGEYVLAPVATADTACPSCLGDDWRDVRPPITVALRVAGTRVRITGAGSDRTIIRTRAGSGIVFDGCDDCALSGVTVTDGERDPDDRATNAAVVVRNGRVTISDTVVLDNVGSELRVQQAFVGISGVVVREGGEATLLRCRIVRSSWDGLTVLRGATATLRGVAIDGVDRAQGNVVGGGRGAGIRVAQGSQLDAEDVLVARHDGGLAVFDSSAASLRRSVIEDSPSWGVLVRGDATGAPEIVLQDVAVHRTASCGVTVRGGDTQPARGRIAGLRLALVAQSGSASTGPCPAVAVDAPGFEVADVLSWRTGGGPAEGAGDAPTQAFQAQAAVLGSTLAAQPAAGSSAFVQAFAGALR